MRKARVPQPGKPQWRAAEAGTLSVSPCPTLPHQRAPGAEGGAEGAVKAATVPQPGKPQNLDLQRLRLRAGSP